MKNPSVTSYSSRRNRKGKEPLTYSSPSSPYLESPSPYPPNPSLPHPVPDHHISKSPTQKPTVSIGKRRYHPILATQSRNFLIAIILNQHHTALYLFKLPRKSLPFIPYSAYGVGGDGGKIQGVHGFTAVFLAGEVRDRVRKWVGCWAHVELGDGGEGEEGCECGLCSVRGAGIPECEEECWLFPIHPIRTFPYTVLKTGKGKMEGRSWNSGGMRVNITRHAIHHPIPISAIVFTTSSTLPLVPSNTSVPVQWTPLLTSGYALTVNSLTIPKLCPRHVSPTKDLHSGSQIR
jgi:hypothetical protein